MLFVHSGIIVRNTHSQSASAEQKLKDNFKTDSTGSKVSIYNSKMALDKSVSKCQIPIYKAEIAPSELVGS